MAALPSQIRRPEQQIVHLMCNNPPIKCSPSLSLKPDIIKNAMNDSPNSKPNKHTALSHPR